MKRTILRSSKGKKLYAERRKDGTFSDIQSYSRAHAADLRHTSKSEKRQRLIAYITGFALRMDVGGKFDRNRALSELLAKIDKLKLF